MEEKNRVITKKKVIIIILILVIVGVVSYNIYNLYHKKARLNDFKNMLDTIDNNFQSWISPYYDEYDLVKDIDASSTSALYYNDENDWYYWNETFLVKINVDNSFDNYTEKEQYDYINEVGNYTISSIDYEVGYQCPNYNRYKRMDSIQIVDLFGIYISDDVEYNIILLTDNNKYRYSTLNNYYYKNNEEIYVGTTDIDIDSILSDDSASNNSSYSENVTDDEKNMCWHLATETVKNNLKSPSDAKFPSSYNSVDVSITKSGNVYTVNSWVESENSYGANLRKRFFVTITKEGSGDSATYTADNCIIE